VSWYCFHCHAAIAFIEREGEISPTMFSKKLHVIGGAPLYCCLRCGAVQMPSDTLREQMREWLQKQQAAVNGAVLVSKDVAVP